MKMSLRHNFHVYHFIAIRSHKAPQDKRMTFSIDDFLQDPNNQLRANDYISSPDKYNKSDSNWMPTIEIEPVKSMHI